MSSEELLKELIKQVTRIADYSEILAINSDKDQVFNDIILNTDDLDDGLDLDFVNEEEFK